MPNTTLTRQHPSWPVWERSCCRSASPPRHHWGTCWRHCEPPRRTTAPPECCRQAGRRGTALLARHLRAQHAPPRNRNLTRAPPCVPPCRGCSASGSRPSTGSWGPPAPTSQCRGGCQTGPASSPAPPAVFAVIGLYHKPSKFEFQGDARAATYQGQELQALVLAVLAPTHLCCCHMVLRTKSKSDASVKPAKKRSTHLTCFLERRRPESWAGWLSCPAGSSRSSSLSWVACWVACVLGCMQTRLTHSCGTAEPGRLTLSRRLHSAEPHIPCTGRKRARCQQHAPRNRVVLTPAAAAPASVPWVAWVPCGAGSSHGTGQRSSRKRARCKQHALRNRIGAHPGSTSSSLGALSGLRSKATAEPGGAQADNAQCVGGRHRGTAQVLTKAAPASAASNARCCRKGIKGNV